MSHPHLRGTGVLSDSEPTLMTSYSFTPQKALSPNAVALGVRALTYGFRDGGRAGGLEV